MEILVKGVINFLWICFVMSMIGACPPIGIILLLLTVKAYFSND